MDEDGKVVTGYTLSMKLLIPVALSLIIIPAAFLVGTIFILAPYYPEHITELLLIFFPCLLMCCAFFNLGFWLWPRRIEIHKDHFSRSGYPRTGHRNVRYEEISKVFFLSSRSTHEGLGFVLNDGFRFYISSKEMDNRCQEIMLQRLKSAGFDPIDKREVIIFPDFLNRKKFSTG